MMSIEVLGHKLPPLLVKLIEDGKWGNRQKLSSTNLNKILTRTGLPAVALEPELATFDAGAMESRLVISRYKQFSDAQARQRRFQQFSQASSKELGGEIEDDGIIDIDKAVYIAGNDKDEVCLDYRENPDNPCVRAFVKTKEFFIDWRIIAPDFETFARELGLVE